MYEWSWVIFAKKTKFHDAGGPDTVVSPIILWHLTNSKQHREKTALMPMKSIDVDIY